MTSQIIDTIATIPYELASSERFVRNFGNKFWVAQIENSLRKSDLSSSAHQ